MPVESPKTRVYPLTTTPDFTEEEIAVTFAMTSRRPEAFDEIAAQVTAQKAADFHEKWVLDYGHSSVAEHAIVHLAVENISRLACDVLEDNRLASYTEKSSRYQTMAPGYFHLPKELEGTKLGTDYSRTCNFLFRTYAELLEGTIAYLKERPKPQEGADPYPGNPARVAPDHCRAILPASTLTNVGITANARTLQNAISKLLSHPLAETRALGADLRDQANRVAPTLLKHAGHSPYLAERQNAIIADHELHTHAFKLGQDTPPTADLVHWEPDQVANVLAAILITRSPISYRAAMMTARALSDTEKAYLIQSALKDITPHDPAPREFEAASYTFEFRMDYGALREFKRHRMQTYLTQPLTIHHGYSVPPLIRDAGLSDVFHKAIKRANTAFRSLHKDSPYLAQYAVTHAHNQQVVARMNLRECYHLFKLRTSNLAHFAIREPMTQAMKQAVQKHPILFKGLKLRDYPAWWPFDP